MDRNYRAHSLESSPFDRGEELYFAHSSLQCFLTTYCTTSPLVLVVYFFIFTFPQTHRSQFLVCVNLLGNRSKSDACLEKIPSKQPFWVLWDRASECLMHWIPCAALQGHVALSRNLVREFPLRDKVPSGAAPRREALFSPSSPHSAGFISLHEPITAPDGAASRRLQPIGARVR